jgi:hypothetical protein
MATNALPDKCGVGTACPGCGRRLPLRFSDHGEEVALWECVGCESPFAGVLLPDIVTMLAQRIRLSQRHLDTEHSQALPFTLRQVIQRIHGAEPIEEVRDLRRSIRLSGLRRAVTVRFDERFGIPESAMHCAIANLSSHGLLLVTGEPIEAGAAVVQVESPRSILQLLVNVVWKQNLGGGCYGSGGEFVTRFGRVDG